jgi:hypothetical protein
MHRIEVYKQLSIIRHNMNTHVAMLRAYRAAAKVAKQHGLNRAWSYYMSECKRRKSLIAQDAMVLHRALYLLGDTDVNPN